MATAEEIRQRVRQADMERVMTRADAAVTVGELVTRHEQARQQVAQVAKQLRAATAQALKLMTPDELAAFTGRRRREVDEWATMGVDGPTRTATRTTPRKTGTHTAGAAEPAAAGETSDPEAVTNGSTGRTDETHAGQAAAEEQGAGLAVSAGLVPGGAHRVRDHATVDRQVL
jgi:hypothetical protein